MNELLFVVDEDLEGGFTARALNAAIFSQAETVEELHRQVRDAVHCHFEPVDMPKLSRLHFVREELISA